ncbi:hypothetical protein P170DRAFT_441211 [Aspergillus steynii IBT 23096]|uniref:Uncharacterized protein n=1 Tax=Aspergillus steynii IBT 23096 TaxID=1392250 RepID=A0A2I2FSZ6_9EURO|nr:uncharacterized protein P170DRAFT_441211 [Aspergillus steynii IBT 23096]PLB43763.1 hypothetical protein P170DRAFT_441211 [Aspergillus steynii IBT 23096]
MSQFPSLKPAFTIKVTIDAPLAVGSLSRSNPLQVIPMTGGSFKSDSNFSPSVDSEFVGVGNDYIHADADGKHLRLNAHSVIKTHDGALIYVNYTGIVTLSAAVQAVFSGSADEGSTPFGDAFTHFTFETGDARYKQLEHGVFVAQGRFNVHKDKSIVVEYRVSQVVHA